MPRERFATERRSGDEGPWSKWGGFQGFALRKVETTTRKRGGPIALGAITSGLRPTENWVFLERRIYEQSALEIVKPRFGVIVSTPERSRRELVLARH